MHSTMMSVPLNLSHFLERAGKLFGGQEIVSRMPDKSLHRYTYADFYGRTRQLAEALQRAGLKRGDRVATLMWNHYAHYESYFGVIVAGGVMHTLNLRLAADDIAFIAKHAEDRFLIVDDVLLPLFEQFRQKVNLERVIVVPLTGKPVPAGFDDYEGLLRTATGDFEYPQMDENEPCAMCYTSGTTGKPKGVVYSHRSQILHSLVQALPDAISIGGSDVMLPVVPMFHANAWGVPYTCVMTGSKLVLAGSNVQPEGLLDLLITERVTVASGVPTVWIGVLDALERNPGRWKLDWPVRVICGGSTPPMELMRKLDRYGIRMLHLWGMTETSPLATASHLKSHMRDWPEEKKYQTRAKQGWTVPFLDLRIMRPEGEVPRDGETPGEIEVRGPWVASHYYEAPDQSHRWTSDGWFKTGDVGVMDEDGIVKIVDRAKDLVKSGGEWISSVDLENTLMGHPAVKEACVVGVPHPKWQERPIAAVVLKDGAAAEPDELLAFLGKTFAKWQLPDAFVFMKEIPRTSVGKFKKVALRQELSNWKWDA